MKMPAVTISSCKKWCTYITMATFFLAGGIEYSVIFPTMFNYVELFGGKEWLYGLSLSAFSISNLITSPIYGLIFDRTKMTKMIILIGNLFEIGGNFMYFTAYAVKSPYMILGSRFLVGLGAGAGATLFAELSLTTTTKQRTTIFSLFMALRQLGLVIGPAFNLFLEITDFNIGPFPVNEMTSPGLFMTLLWIIVELMFLFFFFHLPRVEGDPPKHTAVNPESAVKSRDHPTNSMIKTPPLVSEKTQINDADEKSPLLHRGDHMTDHVTVHYSTLPSRSPTPPHKLSSPTSINSSSQVVVTESDTFPLSEDSRDTVMGGFLKRGAWLLSEMVREEIVVLLGMLFATMFNQVSIEAMFVPMAEDLLLWGERDISFFYSGAGLEIIVGFIVVSLVSRVVGDRWQMLFGLVFEVAGYCWLIGLVGNATKDTSWILGRFLIGGAILLWGLPAVMVTGTSLYSKILPAQIQGFGQGFRRSVFSIGAILGPLWAGGAVSFGGTYFVLLGVPAGLYLLSLLLVLASFTRLKESHSEPQVPPTVPPAQRPVLTDSQQSAPLK